MTGSYDEYVLCYGPTWGRYRDRTRPVPGNHDYETTGAAGYFAYFGSTAGDPTRGYYSFDIGSWHMIALNSNCYRINCAAGSVQWSWLRDDLRLHGRSCVLAYWHTPRFSSGFDGDNVQLADIYALLYAAGADVVLAGHSHDYERFAPMDPNGSSDAARGVRSFVVGTGGAGFTPLGVRRPQSETVQNNTDGVLVLRLFRWRYEWEFVPVEGGRYRDQGSALCHSAP